MTRAKEKLVMVCARAGAAKHLADLCAVTSCPCLLYTSRCV